MGNCEIVLHYILVVPIFTSSRKYFEYSILYFLQDSPFKDIHLLITANAYLAPIIYQALLKTLIFTPLILKTTMRKVGTILKIRKLRPEEIKVTSPISH